MRVTVCKVLNRSPSGMRIGSAFGRASVTVRPCSCQTSGLEITNTRVLAPAASRSAPRRAVSPSPTDTAYDPDPERTVM